MAKITLRQLLDDAAEHGYGVPAFNINNMEQGLAILEAAAGADAPVILQVSRGARSYAGDIMLAHMVDALVEMFPAIPICLHQDHGNNEATCLTALQHGFTSVMMDGSLEADARTPASFDYNVAITAKVAEAAHAVIDYAFGELAAEAVEIRCRVINNASRRVIHKCGFHYQGVSMDVSAVAGRLRRRIWASSPAQGVPLVLRDWGGLIAFNEQKLIKKLIIED